MAYSTFDKLEWITIFVSEFAQRFGLTLKQALSVVLNSDTYLRLQENETALYYQSPRYVFSFLQTELTTGKVG